MKHTDKQRRDAECVAEANADVFVAQHCGHMTEEQRDDWFDVMYDHTLAAILAFAGLVEVERVPTPSTNYTSLGK